MGKKERDKQRQEVYRMCENLGFWNVRNSAIEKQMGIPNQTVSRWKKQWIEKYGIPQIKEFSKELNVNSLAALKEMIKLMKDPNKDIRVKATRAFFLGQEKYTEFLERFGYKDIVTPVTESHITVRFGNPPDKKKEVIELELKEEKKKDEK